MTRRVNRSSRTTPNITATSVRRASVKTLLRFLNLSLSFPRRLLSGCGRSNNTISISIYGVNPSKGKVIGIKLATGVIHWLVFDHIADRNPKAAKIFSKVSVIVQGGVVAANLRFAF